MTDDSGVVEHFDEDGCMDSDVRDALDQLDSVTTVASISVPTGAEISPGETPRPVPKPRSMKKADLEQKNRDITEVRHRADEAEVGAGGVRAHGIAELPDLIWGYPQKIQLSDLGEYRVQFLNPVFRAPFYEESDPQYYNGLSLTVIS